MPTFSAPARHSSRSGRHAILRRRRGVAVLLVCAPVAVATLVAVGTVAPERSTASGRWIATVDTSASTNPQPGLLRGGFNVISDPPRLRDVNADLLAAASVVRIEAADDTSPSGPAADLAIRVVAAEGSPGRSPVSSAAGYGQFLSTTWLEEFGRAYPDIARMLSSDQILALRYVKPLALALTSRYARENAATLVRNKLPATETALSLAHAVGAGGAMTVLLAPPGAPVGDLLSPKAVSANPVFSRMTAEDLRGWATNRIGGGAVPPPNAPAADPVPSLEPGEDFLIDRRIMASEVLRANFAMIGRLREATHAVTPARGLLLTSPNASTTKSSLVDRQPLLTRSEAPAAVLLEAIGTVWRRPGYGQFRILARRGREHSRLPVELVRDLTLVVIGKMEDENARILGIAQHRRGLTREAHHLPAQRPADRIGPPAASGAPRAGRS